MTNGLIYKITCEKTSLSYIGKTIQKLETRLSAHKSDFSCCRLLSKAIKEYGWNIFYVEILWEGPSEILGEMEKCFIEEHDTLSPGGYNMRGGGGRSEKISDELKKLLINGQREYRKRIQGGLLGSIKEHRAKNDKSIITSWTFKINRNGKCLKVANSTNKEELLQMQRDFTEDPDGYIIPESTYGLDTDRGIWFRKCRNKWIVRLNNKALGSYSTKEEAVRVRDQYEEDPENFPINPYKNREHVGVTFHNKKNKWEAKFYKDKKHTFLGHYDSKEEAIASRKKFIESPDTFVRPRQRKKIKI